MGMFKKYHSSSYAIIIALVVVLLSPVLGCAQSEGNKLTSKKPSVNKPGQNVVLNPAIKGSQAVLEKKDAEINTVKKELSTAKTELVKARMARVQKDKQINGLSIAIKSMQAAVKKKDAELAAVNTALKSLQAAVKKKDTELVALDTELFEMDTELVLLDKEAIVADTKLIAAKTAVNCYRKALSTWDGLHRQEGITEQNLLTIAVELRRTIANCPGI